MRDPLHTPVRRLRACLGILVSSCAVALLAAPASAGEIRSIELPSPPIDTTTPGGRLAGGGSVPQAKVILPDGFDRRSTRGYPVLYFLHGAFGGAADERWIEFLEEQFAGFPGIVVAPDGGMFGMYVDWWNDGARGDPSWAALHLKTLRREVERRYPIRPQRRWHAIAGISMGGQGTLRYAAMLPGYFGTAVGFSAAVPDMQDPMAQLGVDLLTGVDPGGGVEYARVFGPADGIWAEGMSPQTLVPNLGRTRIYLTSGDGTNCPEDPPSGNPAVDALTETTINRLQHPFAAAARARGARVASLTTCGIHTQGVWDRALPLARAWGYFRPVAEHPRRWTYRTVATSGEMWNLRFRFEAPPAEMAQFERRGPRLTATGSGRVVLRAGKACRLSLKLPFERKLPKPCR